MIEATCAACGTLNRIAEADVSVGAKFVTCASCKSRVALPSKTMGAIPAIPKPVLPALPRTPPKTPPAGVKRTGALDLADLPAPKRSSPLAGAEPSKPAPRSALGDLEAELPAPKAATRTAPIAATQPIDLDDLMSTDLPAPKAKSAGISDLPAPKARPPVKTPAKPTPTIADLPTPKVRSAIADLPTPKAKPAIADLPTPKPKAAKPPATPFHDIVDLPTPKPAANIVDLPTPKPGSDIIDLPMPKPGANNDLPAPKGFFDDLPQPARASSQHKSDSGIDLPAPKGFFDDLPQPARASSQAKSDEIAPKGFFDDLPQPARASSQLPNDEVAPKGFFDDLPPPAKAPPTPSLPLSPAAPVVPAPAERGLFDDLPEPDMPTAGAELSSSDLFSGSPDLDLGPSSVGLQLEESVPNIDLAPAGPSTTMEQLDDLDLSAPSAKSGIRIGTPAAAKKPAGDGAALNPIAPYKPGGELKLELEATPDSAAKLAAPKRKAAAAAKAEVDQTKKRRTKLVLGAVLGLALVGGGGFFLYQRHEAQQAKADEIATDLARAKTALHAGDPLHWQHAAAAAKAVLELDPTNGDALGLGAEALIAGALDTGVAGPARIAQGRKMLQDALEASVAGPAIDRAQGLGAIALNQPDRAVTKLQALVARAPKDGFLLLYLGWAQAAKGDPAAAIKAFDQAIEATPAAKVPALYARGRAKMAIGDLDGARADFTAVFDAQKDHIGAQVGLANALPQAQTSQREKDLLAILERKDIATGDPRAVVQAWTLAADVARLGGRLDVARDRYRKALVLAATDVSALTGLAEVELSDNKLPAAADEIQKALAQAADDPNALLVEADVWLRQGKVDAAVDLTKQLAARTPPLPKLMLSRLAVLRGKILEIQGQDDDAIDAYVEAAKIAGDLDLDPTITAAAKLGALAKKASDAKDDKKAAGYRARADELLSSLASRAQDDPQLSMTLGVAYLQAGDPVKAETFLRRAVEMHANDIEAKLALAKALVALGRTDDSIEQLRGAAELDKSRTDIALELARTFEAAKRNDEATAAYDRLLADPAVTVESRIRAGRYFARMGDMKKAGGQADPILAADPDNAAGHYLKGEALILGGKLDDARKELNTAVDADPDPQYLDAQGRAAEASLAASDDTKYQDLALRAYQRATETAPTMMNPLVGQGRMYIARKELSKAVPPLLAANQLDRTNPEVMYLLGVAYQGLQQKDVAIKWLSASTHGRADPEAYWRLGQLYIDANRGREAVTALAEATRLGAEQEQKLGKPIAWLTDAFYDLGDTELKLNIGGTKAAWQRFVDRKPPDDARLADVKQHLATDLR